MDIKQLSGDIKNEIQNKKDFIKSFKNEPKNVEPKNVEPKNVE